MGVLACAGCQQPPAHPPQSLAALEAHRESGSQDFTDRTIALHNVRRVLDKSLPADQRVASMQVVERLDAAYAEAYPALARVLSEADAPPALCHGVLALLIGRNYPGLDKHVVAALPHATDAKLRAALVAWLLEHPSPNLLTDVVKLWAAEGKAEPEVESRFRRIVERMSASDWDTALLNAINAENFFARGSAIEVLAARIPAVRLRREIALLPARTPAAQAMKYFSERFAYVPKTGRELLCCVVLHGRERQRLDLAAKLAYEWQLRYEYSFNVRDFHLLSRLAGDPLRKPLQRRELIREISRGIAVRAGSAGPGRVSRPVFRGRRLVSFSAQAESLSTADLWNLLLINEMLNRPRVRLALKIMAERDSEDRQTQWGGLVRYDQGQADAKLYPPTEKRGDDQYVPPQQWLEDAIDSMAFFVGHFRRPVNDVSQADPSQRELALAKEHNLYGLILASVSPATVRAMYLNPEGTIVDLGIFPADQ